MRGCGVTPRLRHAGARCVSIPATHSSSIGCTSHTGAGDERRLSWFEPDDEDPAMKAAFQWDDAFRLDDQLDDEERAVRDAARDYCQSRLQPRVLMAARHETFDRSIMTEMGELGMLGSTIDGYGC